MYYVHDRYEGSIQADLVTDPINEIVSRFKSCTISQWDPDTDEESYEFYAIYPVTVSAPFNIQQFSGTCLASLSNVGSP